MNQEYDWHSRRHCLPALLARNTIGAAISSGCPTRFMACIWAMWSMRSGSGVPFFSAICSKTSVWMAAARNTQASAYKNTGRVPFPTPDRHMSVHQSIYLMVMVGFRVKVALERAASKQAPPGSTELTRTPFVANSKGQVLCEGILRCLGHSIARHHGGSHGHDGCHRGTRSQQRPAARGSLCWLHS